MLPSTDQPRKDTTMPSKVRSLAVTVAAAFAAFSGPTSAASAESPAVINVYEPEIVNTIPFVGCGGTPVTTTFVGWLRATMIVFADGSTSLTLTTREDATWHQDGVDYTAAVTFNLHQTLRRGEVTTAVTNGTGNGSDGSQVRLHYVQHLMIDADGSLIRSFDRGVAECS